MVVKVKEILSLVILEEIFLNGRKCLWWEMVWGLIKYGLMRLKDFKVKR